MINRIGKYSPIREGTAVRALDKLYKVRDINGLIEWNHILYQEYFNKYLSEKCSEIKKGLGKSLDVLFNAGFIYVEEKLKGEQENEPN